MYFGEYNKSVDIHSTKIFYTCDRALGESLEIIWLVINLTGMII